MSSIFVVLLLSFNVAACLFSVLPTRNVSICLAKIAAGAWAMVRLSEKTLHELMSSKMLIVDLTMTLYMEYMTVAIAVSNSVLN